MSIGNKADVSSNDLLEYWEDDLETDLILLYLESFGNPRKFARIAKRVARSKPILAMRTSPRCHGSVTCELQRYRQARREAVTPRMPLSRPWP